MEVRSDPVTDPIPFWMKSFILFCSFLVTRLSAMAACVSFPKTICANKALPFSDKFYSAYVMDENIVGYCPHSNVSTLTSFFNYGILCASSALPLWTFLRGDTQTFAGL